MMTALTQENLPNEYISTYLDEMEKLVEDNIDFLQDPQALSHAFNLSFEIMYSYFRDNINSIQDLCFNDLLYKATQDNDNPLLSCDFGFIKHIHIFNFAKDKYNGAIDIGIDFVNQKVLDTCTILKGGNSLYRIDTMAILYNNTSGFFGNNIIEYCHEPYNLILNPRSFSTVTSKVESDNNKRVYCFSNLFKFLLKTEENIQTSILWFDEFEKNNYNCLDNTNFYFIQSNSGEGIVFEDNWKYVLYANIGIDSTKANKDCINTFIQKFSQFLDRISIVILLSIKDYQTRQKSNISAIAQVMARNMSHNIGSHVFSHLVGNGAYEKLSDKSVSELDSYISCYEESKKEEQSENADNYKLVLFNKYLKNRMDYLSEVTFGVPNILTTKYMYSDVFKELDRVRILLNYISGIQGFKYTFCLKRNGVVLKDENDIAIAFPSDVLGNQAFYNIIENIIRNTAKHACNNKRDIVTFTIEFTVIEDYPEYYCVEIDNGIEESDIDELVKKQNIRINTSVLDKDNNLRSHSLGLLEMEVSAAFLRQVDIAKVDSYEYHFEVMDVYKNKYNNLILLKAINKNGALGYRFFMQKPKEFLLVGNFDVADSKKDAVGKEGVQFIIEEDFAKAMSDGKSFAHPFLLYSNNVSDKTKVLLSNDNDCKTLLPIRKVELAQDEIKEVVTIINDKGNIVLKLKAFAWNKYMQSIGLESDDIYIGEVVGRRKFSNCRQVVFTNHGKNFETYLGNVKELPELWIDSLSSYRQGKLPLFASYSLAEDNTEEPLTRYVNTIPPQLKMEIFEAYHNKVVALDERIQHFSLESYEGSISASTLFNATNVIIPKTKLDPEQFDESMIHELEIFINNEINGAFLLVHYGILERMYKTEKAISEHIEAWAKKAKRVVVTSGRGSHSLQLPASVCFANLSSVLNAFTESRCKFLINCLINQSRRKNE